MQAYRRGTTCPVAENVAYGLRFMSRTPSAVNQLLHYQDHNGRQHGELAAGVLQVIGGQVALPSATARALSLPPSLAAPALVSTARAIAGASNIVVSEMLAAVLTTDAPRRTRERRFLAGLPKPPNPRLAGRNRGAGEVPGFWPKWDIRSGARPPLGISALVPDELAGRPFCDTGCYGKGI